MTDTNPSVPSTTKNSSDDKVRSTLIFLALGVAAAIIFGVLYLFVLAPSVPNGSIGWFLFSFATGLTMIVMPCTLPLAFVIVPLSMGKGVIKGLGMALSFGLGVAVMLSTYGIIAALLGGAALNFLGADIESLKNWVYFFAGTFAFIFALGELGLINVHMPTYSGAAPAFIQKRGEFIKAFLLGLFLGNVGVGCPHPATPLILIEIATSGDVLYGWLLFLTHAVGRVLPLLLLAFLAILGVNGLNWLMTRKESVERVTGWMMVFVAGFILTLGLFTHDWWVNSGLHSGLEAITQESYFNEVLNTNFGTAVEHLHGLEEGVGLFGQPLWWGHYFLVLVWLIPIWWWYVRKRKNLYQHPTFAFKRLEYEVDRLEAERDRIEETYHIDELNTNTDLKVLKTQIAELKKQRRAAAKLVDYGETDAFKSELVRDYEVKILGMRRNFIIFVSVVLALVFIYFLPTNFYYKSTGGTDHHGAVTDTAGIHVMSDGTVMDGSGQVMTGAHVMPDGTIMLADGTAVGMAKKAAPAGDTFTTNLIGVKEAKGLQFVTLSDGDTYDVEASYVKKEIGNRTLRMMAYNGSVPGPFIKAPQGSTVTINFTNNTDLDQTIHSHGLRLDNNFDGVPGYTQNVVKPGQTFAYTITFPDAGVYWYHPHTRDDYGQELGLYGNYFVEPTDPNYWNDVNREEPLVIDDILINNDKIADFYKDFTNFALLGRFGNTFLVNGEVDYTTQVTTGEVIRYFMTNVSNARTYNLSIPGAQIKKVGADIGRFEREEFTDTVLISPAERVVIEVYFPRSGTYKLTQNTPNESFELARFVAKEGQLSNDYTDVFKNTRINTDVVAEFADFRNQLNRPADKEILLTIDLGSMAVDHSLHNHSSAPVNDSLQKIQWSDPMQSDVANVTPDINWQIVDTKTGKVSMDIDDWIFKQNSLVKISITNDPNADHVMQHPIHFHGQQFVVLATNGVANENMAWKDTTLVLPGDTVDILVDMSNLGAWMTHCHISEHLHAGMMLNFRVEDENGYATGDEFRATVTPPPSSMESMTNNGTPEAATADKYEFNTPLKPTTYGVTVSPSTFKAGKLQEFTLALYDENDKSVLTSSSVNNPLTVSFVSSDNRNRLFTYPGNSAFATPIAPVTPDETPTGNMPGTPGFDESMPHSHSFLSIPVAYAHGDEHSVADFSYTYTMPVLFTEKGFYRAYVEFIPDGQTETQIVTFDVEVAPSGFSVDNFGWSKTMKWWILLLTSLFLMVPLVYGVRRYISIAK